MSFGEHDLFNKIFLVVFIIILVIGSLLGFWLAQVLLGLFILVVILSVIGRFTRKKRDYLKEAEEKDKRGKGEER